MCAGVDFSIKTSFRLVERASKQAGGARQSEGERVQDINNKECDIQTLKPKGKQWQH